MTNMLETWTEVRRELALAGAARAAEGGKTISETAKGSGRWGEPCGGISEVG